MTKNNKTINKNSDSNLRLKQDLVNNQTKSKL